MIRFRTNVFHIHFRLIVLQFILPNISFYGHLSGIITGFLQSSGLLNWVIISDEQRLRNMEDWPMLSILTRSPAFVPANSGGATLMTHSLPLVETVTSAVEGVGRFAAELFYRCRRHAYHQTAITEDSIDAEWNGLPNEDAPTREFV